MLEGLFTRRRLDDVVPCRCEHDARDEPHIRFIVDHEHDGHRPNVTRPWRVAAVASLHVNTCSHCGTIADTDDELPPGWSLVTDERGLGRLCLTCTRTNIRSIEAKLPEEWWE